MVKQRNIVVTLECFVKKDGKYLMLHRNANKKIMPGVWMAAGGKRDFNEGLFECARREVREETGLAIKNLCIKAIGNAYLKDLKEEFYFHMLVADYAGGKLISNHREGKFSWLLPSEILGLDNLLAELRYILPHIFSDSQDVISYKAVYEKGNELVEFQIEDSG